MNHNHKIEKEVENKSRCVCGEECLCLGAEKLSVSCGCGMEAKQFEYKMDEKCCHTEHARFAHRGPMQTERGHTQKDVGISKYEHEYEKELKNGEEVVYTCPMHPEVVKDEPGLCPGCGMALVPKIHEAAMPAHHSFSGGGTNLQMAKKMEQDMRRRFFISFFLSIPIFLYSPVGINFFGLNLPTPIPINWLLFILTTPIVFWTGSIFITGAYYSLKAKKLNMAVLVATGVLAAYLFSVLLTFIRPQSETFYEAAALLVTFVLFGHWMEMKSRRGTSDALRALFDLVPPKANVIRGGKEMNIPSAEIVHGDIVVLRPGDKVPVDGEIIEGESSVDESLVTGESIPVSKTIGAKVIGGSVNQTGTVKFKATQVGSETVLAQIIKMVETAQNSKAPGQRIADKAAAYLVVLAIGSGLAAFFGWYFV